MGIKNEQEFKDRLKAVSLRYTLDQVRPDLPPEIKMVYKFDMSPKTRKMYKEIRDEKTMTYENIKKNIFEEKVVKNVLEEIIRLAQVSSGFMPFIENFDTVQGKIIELGNAKLKLLERILEEYPKKVIIWCRFKPSIKRVSAMLKKKKISHYIYDGDTKEDGLYLKYQNDDTRVWLAQISRSSGYSIPAATHSLFYEIDYNFINWLQAKGRSRRLVGTKEACVYGYLLANDSIEEHILDVLEAKQEATEKLLKD